MAVATFLLAVSAPAAAQSEDALRAFFEGRQVRVKIDMPGSSDGIDVKADARGAIDYPRYGDRVKRFGVAIHTDEAATITLVKVKKDLVEVQLNGGGFGTFGDDTSTSVYLPYVERSSREKELEKKIKDETDRRRKREMKEELDDLIARRERQNRRIDGERAQLEEQKRLRVADERLRGGSRFNVRYTGAVPNGIGPEDVMAALAAYVDFSGLRVQEVRLPRRRRTASRPALDVPRAGGRRRHAPQRDDPRRSRAGLRTRARIDRTPRRRHGHHDAGVSLGGPAHFGGVRRRRARALHDHVAVGRDGPADARSGLY